MTIRLILFLAFAVISCWTVIARGQSPEKEPQQVEVPTTSDANPDPVDLQQAAVQIIESTNALRREKDLQPVARQQQLQQAAQQFAEFMAQNDLYGHQADDRTPAERAQAAGYEYCMVRENIAYRTDTGDNTASGLAETFFTGWKESPEHRQNLLAEHVTDTAVAIATTDGTTFYAVQMFGRPRTKSIQVRVRNRSEAVAHLKIETDYGVDSFELPPQTIATFTRCLPSTLTLKDSPRAFQVDQSASFQIVAGDDGKVRIERQQDNGAGVRVEK